MQYENLFERHQNNPILKAEDWPYPIHSVFNPGATLLADGTTLLLCRVEDRRGLSHLCAARSANGIDGWEIDETPTFAPDPENFPEELWGVEDARITYVPEESLYLIAYTAFSKSGPGVAIAATKDFKTFERYGLVMPPDDKDAAIFPRRFEGNYLLIHRPVSDMGANIWLSTSPDLRNWGGLKLMLPARRGGWWDANKIGLSPPPIETPQGWLLLYHGVRTNAAGALYRVGIALMDKDDPSVCLLRGQSWIFGPETSYETTGDVPNAVFPCGVTLLPDGDTLHIYYGAADTTVCLATASVKALLAWLDNDGTTMTGIAGQPAERASLNVPS